MLQCLGLNPLPDYWVHERSEVLLIEQRSLLGRKVRSKACSDEQMPGEEIDNIHIKRNVGDIYCLTID